MKNTIPLIVAVLTGLVAAYSVRNAIARASQPQGKMHSIVVANVPLAPGTPISAGECDGVPIPDVAYLPGRHILSSQLPRIEGLEVKNRIERGSHVLWDDLNTETASERVGNGEFVVAVKFQESPLVGQLRPNDEIAIAATQVVEETERREKDLSAAPRIRRVEKMTVLFPCVKVLDAVQGGILVSAPPEQALRLLVASRSFPLHPMLRRTGDASNRSVGVGGSVSSGDLTPEALAGE